MINTASGMHYFVSTLGVDLTDIPAAFSFQDQNIINQAVIPDYWATGSSSGILNPGFYTGIFNDSGKAIFDGNTYFELSQNYSFENSIIFISYKKERIQNEVLFSSFTGNGTDNSGFWVGINDANKLYIKYWNSVEGLFGFTYPPILADNNILLIYKEPLKLTLGHFNNNTLQFETEDFEIYNNNFTNSNKLLIGGSPLTPTKQEFLNTNAQNFSGSIDKFYIFNNTPLIYNNVLASGLFSEVTGVEGEWLETCYTSGYLQESGYSYTGVTGIYSSGYINITTGITGFTNIISEYSYTGVTGSQETILGYYTDNCGNTDPIIAITDLSGIITEEITIRQGLTGEIITTGYSDVELTGFITGSTIISVTGTICDQSFIQTGNNIQYKKDDEFLASLSYKQFTVLSRLNPQNDLVEIFYLPYQNQELKFNQDLAFDTFLENYYADTEYNQNDIVLFANGQALTNSGYRLLESGYETLKIPQFDYFITGNSIEVNKYFTANDYLFYDYLTGNTNIVILENYNSGDIINILNSNNAFIYHNGQKLISGQHYYNYSNTGISFRFDIPDSGLFLIKYVDLTGFETYLTKGNTLDLIHNTNHQSLIVYLNGLRQKLNNNYIEHAKFDLISGDFNEDILTEPIYNNTDDFFV